MTPARPELVIFDCDGVLVDSEPITARVLAANLTRHGWRVGPEDADRFFTGGTIFGVRDVALENGAALPDDWVDAVYQEIFAALADVPAVDGVEPVLDLLDAAAIPYCIGSNGPHEKMDVTLVGAGIAERFDGRRFSAREVEEPKPAPDLFLFAAEQMGLAPGRCVVVGDTINDAKAARSAGMRCLGYAAHTSPDDFYAHGAEPFSPMSAPPSLLGV